MKIGGLIIVLSLLGAMGCTTNYERMEIGKVVGIAQEETQTPQDDGSMLPGDIIEVGKIIQVKNVTFTVRYKSANSFISTAKVGDCVKILMKVYRNPIFGDETFIPAKSEITIQCN